MYKGVQCIMSISPLLIPSLDHSEVFEMEGEFQVKGGKRDVYFYSLLHSLAFLSVQYLNDWIFSPPIDCCLLIMFVSSQCAFGVAVPHWPKSGGVSKGRRGLARGWCGWAPEPVLGWHG